MGSPVVHLELRTDNLARACAFYTALLGWEVTTTHAGGLTYRTLEMGGGVGGGVVEQELVVPEWLPYVEVEDVAAATSRARRLGAQVEIEVREGPAGWRTVLRAPSGARVALWQRKH